jgi:hypothetical protein
MDVALAIGVFVTAFIGFLALTATPVEPLSLEEIERQRALDE